MNISLPLNFICYPSRPYIAPYAFFSSNIILSILHLQLTTSTPLTSYTSTIVSIYGNTSDKTIYQLIAEIRYCRDWIGVDFLEHLFKFKEDKKQVNTDEHVTDEGVRAEEFEMKSVKLLDYARGTGIISRVSLSCKDLLTFLYLTFVS